MKELIGIKGYYNEMFEGFLLREENGWFEGIVSSPNSSYNGDRLIIGTYHPDKVFELYLISPLSASEPLIFCVSKDDSGYSGDVSIIDRNNILFMHDGYKETVGHLRLIGLFGAKPLCTANIETIQLYDDLTDEKNKLEERIDNFKKTLLYADGLDFYLHAHACATCHKNLCGLVLKDYEETKVKKYKND